MKENKWIRLLAYVTGLVNQELLLQNEYLAAENRILRAHQPARLCLSDPGRSMLAEIGKRLGRKALAQVASVAKPDTTLAWYRKLIAQKFDGGAKADCCLILEGPQGIRKSTALRTLAGKHGTRTESWSATLFETVLKIDTACPLAESFLRPWIETIGNWTLFSDRRVLRKLIVFANRPPQERYSDTTKPSI
jgi:hypothetical protein